MKTGTTTVNLDGDTHNFLFSKTGGAEGKGKGVSGIDGGKYIYKYGKRIKAGTDDKYEVVMVLDSQDIGSELPGAGVAELSGSDLRKTIDNTYKNKEDDTVRFALYVADSDAYLINSTGTIVKNKTAAKDGDDWYYYVQDKYIRMYANSKSLSPKMIKNADGTTSNYNGDLDLSKWKDFTYTEDDVDVTPDAKAADAKAADVEISDFE